MTDSLALNTAQPVLDEPEALADSPAELIGHARKPLHVRLARHISNILSPTSVSIPLVFLVALYKAASVSSALLYSALTLFFLSIGPFIYILIGVRLGKLSDVDVSRRSQRLGPFAFGLFSVCLGWLALALTHGPTPLMHMLIVTALSGVIMMVITLWWKISLHAGSLGAAATILTLIYGASMLPLFLLLILVSWSRVVLRRHTLAQVIAGSILSIVLSATILKFIGL